MFPHYLDNETILELLGMRHARELYRCVDTNRNHLREWLPWVDETRSIEDSLAFIRQTRVQLQTESGFHTAIRFRGGIVGVIGYHAIDWDKRSTSLGYWLAWEAQGLGIVSRACRSFIDHAFAYLSLNRIEIRCAKNNRRSRAVPARLGFREEGTLTEAELLNGRFVDHVLYATTASEWGTRQSKPKDDSGV